MNVAKIESPPRAKVDAAIAEILRPKWAGPTWLGSVLPNESDHAVVLAHFALRALATLTDAEIEEAAEFIAWKIHGYHLHEASMLRQKELRGEAREILSIPFCRRGLSAPEAAEDHPDLAVAANTVIVPPPGEPKYK
jgi:hypothetical protein